MRAPRPSLVLALALVGCGGTGAALNAQPYPGDRAVNGRRLESLARDFEAASGCTEDDVISIVGLSPGVYAAEGCGASAEYTLDCRPGVYSQICSWNPIAPVTLRAAGELACGAEYLDVVVTAPTQRLVSGCGRQATYALSCSGTCLWTPVSGVTPVDGSIGVGGAYTY